jgi:hypothetical protein
VSGLPIWKHAAAPGGGIETNFISASTVRTPQDEAGPGKEGDDRKHHDSPGNAGDAALPIAAGVRRETVTY